MPGRSVLRLMWLRLQPIFKRSFDNTSTATVDRKWEIGAIALLLLIAASAPIRFFPDSGGYLLHGEMAFGKLSFSGDAIRAWPTVLVFSLGVRVGVVIQYLIYGIAVVTFTRSIRALTYGWQRIALTFLTIGFLLSRPMMQWHAAVLSESLTLSLVILSLSFFVRFVILRSGHLLGLACIASSLVMALNRPTLVPLFVLLSGCVVMECIRRKRYLIAALKILLTFSFSIYLASANQAISTSWSAGGGFANTSFMFAYMTADYGSLADQIDGSSLSQRIRSSVRSEASDELFEAFSGDPDVPSCLTNVRSDPSCKYCHGEVIVESCPRDVSWLNNNFSAWYARFLVEHPTRTLKLSALALFDGAQFAQYAFPWSPVPPALEKVFTGFEFPLPFPALAVWIFMVPVFQMWIRRNKVDSDGFEKPGEQGSWWIMLIVLLGSLAGVILPGLMIGFDLGRLSSAGVASCYLTLFTMLGLSQSPRDREQVVGASQGANDRPAENVESL